MATRPGKREAGSRVVSYLRVVQLRPKPRTASFPLAFKEWNEEDHPRDEQGRFDGGGGGSASSVPIGSSSEHEAKLASKNPRSKSDDPNPNEWIEFDDSQAAADFLMDHYPGFSANFDGMDPKLTNEVANDFRRLYDEYPEVGAYVSEISSDDMLGHGVYAQTQTTADGAKITLSQNAFADYQSLQENTASDEDLGWHVVGTSENPGMGILTHEFGHAVSSKISREARRPIPERQELKGKLDRVIDVYNDPGRQTELGNVAKYGLTGLNEAFAEMFTAVQFGSTRQPCVKEMKALLEEAKAEGVV